jgi:hypothetical protein
MEVAMPLIGEVTPTIPTAPCAACAASDAIIEETGTACPPVNATAEPTKVVGIYSLLDITLFNTDSRCSFGCFNFRCLRIFFIWSEKFLTFILFFQIPQRIVSGILHLIFYVAFDT